MPESGLGPGSPGCGVGVGQVSASGLGSDFVSVRGHYQIGVGTSGESHGSGSGALSQLCLVLGSLKANCADGITVTAGLGQDNVQRDVGLCAWFHRFRS